MRRKEKQIEERSEIDTIIHAAQVCRLAMCMNDRPYLVPLSFGYDGRALYLHTAVEGKKIDHFIANKQVCFEFEHNVRIKADEELACKWSTAYESIIGEGQIDELTDPQEKAHGLNQIMQHYSGKSWTFKSEALAKTRLWKVTIASICGKRSV
jgi:nitroimidazol reductase NimA-like FMN-containing flavoprotein (pyridoxamine 5'-phosphate oxidase superfamily)